MKFKKPLILLTIVPLSSCGGNVLNRNIYAFDTMNSIHLYEGEEKDLDELEKIIVNYDKLCDNYNSRDVNNVYTINNTHEDVSISEDLYKLLQLSDTLTNEIEYFNIYCGKLAKIWKEALKTSQIPAESVISEQLEIIKNTKLLFKENNIVQRVGDGEIDLGAISKGYVTCRLFDYFNSCSLKNYLVSLGDSSILLGDNGIYNHDLFDIGISTTGLSLNLDNCFISTSGIEHQSVTIGDKTYSHIINPITGNAVPLYDLVLVIAKKGYMGDVLSTVFMLSNLESIKQLEEKYEAKAIVISKNKIVYSNPDLDVLNNG